MLLALGLSLSLLSVLATSWAAFYADILGSPTSIGSLGVVATDHELIVQHSRQFGTEYWWVSRSLFAPTAAEINRPMTPPSWLPCIREGSGNGSVACGYGWPVVCMKWEGTMQSRRIGKGMTGSTTYRGLFTTNGKRPPIPVNETVSIPLLLIWPNLLIDTAFYAVLSFGLFAAHRALRRRRYPKGHCPACGYDLQSLTTCPECGGGTMNA